MNEERVINLLARAARGDGPPVIDLAGRIVARLPAARRRTDPVLWIFTAASGLAAAAAIVAAMLIPHVTADPMAEFLNSVGSFM